MGATGRDRKTYGMLQRLWCQLQARSCLTSLFRPSNATAVSQQAQRSALPFGWSEREADARTYAVAGALPECLGDCSPGPAYECVWSPATLFTPHIAFKVQLTK